MIISIISILWKWSLSQALVLNFNLIYSLLCCLLFYNLILHSVLWLILLCCLLYNLILHFQLWLINLILLRLLLHKLYLLNIILTSLWIELLLLLHLHLLIFKQLLLLLLRYLLRNLLLLVHNLLINWKSFWCWNLNVLKIIWFLQGFRCSSYYDIRNLCSL